MGYQGDWGDDDPTSISFGTAETSNEVVVGDISSIPLVDISPIFSSDITERLQVAAKLREACINVGFFYIENHGVPQELIDDTFEWGKRFFDLPLEEKMECFINNVSHYRGYTPLYGSGKADANGKGNANEAFDIGHDVKLNDDPDEQYIDPHMRGENPWPRQLPEFERHMSTYYRTMRDFCRILACSVALSLGLEEDYFKPIFSHPGCSQLVAHYPPQAKTSLSKGLDAHTDAEFFTVLAPGDVRALEVLNRQGQWISAPPRPGCFIVNVGDQLQILTNDLYISTKHRVMNYSGLERYSIPFFFSANFETVIEPIPELVADGYVARHGKCSAGEMYKQTMVGLHRIALGMPEFQKWVKPISNGGSL